MSHITEDLVLGARYRYDQSGAMLLRLFDVSGLTPGRDTLAQAAGAVDSSGGSRIPGYGEPHPTVPGLYVLDIEAEPVSNSRTSAVVKVRYGTPEAGSVLNAVRVSIHGTGRYKQVSRLPDGSPLDCPPRALRHDGLRAARFAERLLTARQFACQKIRFFLLTDSRYLSTMPIEKMISAPIAR